MAKDDHPSCDPRELDYLYNELDKLYGHLAQRCGLSPCAYWMMYEIVSQGGAALLREMTDSWSYSKQTINSALKKLVDKGLVVLEFEPGSKKNKVVQLTETGRAFAHAHIVPTISAEERAFARLGTERQRLLIESTRAYAHALMREFDALERLEEGDAAK